jgi:hypothetical protein
MTAIHEFVVPRSIPRILLIFFSFVNLIGEAVLPEDWGVLANASGTIFY